MKKFIGIIKKGLSKLAFFLFVAVFSSILYLFVLDRVIMPYLVDVARVQTPGLRGLPTSQAERILERSGLHMAISDTLHHETLEAGKVLNQDPPPGLWIRKGRRITVEVSTGPSFYPVPETIVGVSLREAQLRLDAGRLGMGLIAYISSENIPEGVVIRATPPSGTLLPRNTPVDLEISHGSPRHPKLVPQVQGLLIEEVRDTLRKHEMRLGEIVHRFDPSRPKGTVLAQTPQAQQRVPRLTAIDLVVSVPETSATRIDTTTPPTRFPDRSTP